MVVFLADGPVQVEGAVTELLPNAMVRVELVGGGIVLAHVAGKVRLSWTRILVGDRVTVEVSPYDRSRGRVTHRYK